MPRNINTLRNLSKSLKELSLQISNIAYILEENSVLSRTTLDEVETLVKGFLDKTQFTTQEVREKIPHRTKEYINSALQVLTKRGLIVRLKRGWYKKCETHLN